MCIRDSDRSWASLLYSSAKGGFSIIDKDRSAGLVFVNYEEDTRGDEGFFSKWFGGDEEIIKTDYRVIIKDVGTNVEIRVVGASGDSLGKAEALRMLSILRSNLS